MAVSALTAQLPSLAGSLPDLFRRTDDAAVRGDDTQAASRRHDGAASPDDHRATLARAVEDASHATVRRSVAGPLTYGRRMASADLAAAAPVGQRGALLDVRG